MKVDSKHITEMIGEVKALLGGIEEVFRDGEYVEEGINGIAENVTAVLNSFAMQYMTPPKAELPKRQHRFLERYDEIDRKQENREYTSKSENDDFFKAQLYLYLKNDRLRDAELPINLDAWKLAYHILDHYVEGGKFNWSLTSPFVNSVETVCKVLADEVIAYRQKHPQIEMMFIEPVEERKPSRSLIDIL